MTVLEMSSKAGPAFLPIVPGKVILNGENPFIRLSHAPGEPLSTDASLWTVTYSTKGSGHALFIKSELTDNKWRIYSDNPEMVSWLQSTVQKAAGETWPVKYDGQPFSTSSPAFSESWRR